MNALSQAIEVIHQAESDVRHQLLRAAEHGDYEVARTLAEWANHLKQMLEQHRGSESEGELRRAEGVAKPIHSESIAEAFVPAVPRRSTAKPKTLRRSRSNGVKRSKTDYPKFLRDGDELLKIGWSKREKKAYRHKAPKRVVLLVSQALQRAGHDGNRFAMEEILPLRDPDSEGDVPTYQAYLSLAWLRKERLIVQHGRQGYTLATQAPIEPLMEMHWASLPIR